MGVLRRQTMLALCLCYLGLTRKAFVRQGKGSKLKLRVFFFFFQQLNNTVPPHERKMVW